MRRLAVLVAILVTVVPTGGAAAQEQPPPLPASMAAIGDSITRAFDACCWYGDHPMNSWSTGTARWDGVASHAERIRTGNPALRSFNDAVSGAKMADGPTQAHAVVAQQVEFVTMLLGANDLCTSSPATMTAVETFQVQVSETLDILTSGLPPSSRIFVSSVPDVYRLWELYHTHRAAQFVWDVANICQSLLGPERTEEERQLVRQRNIAFNDVLAQECAARAQCRFDDEAVFAFGFDRSHVSRLDYFHPNLSGQSELAAITWAQTWWGGAAEAP